MGTDSKPSEPKLSAAEERQWDSLATGMERYHAHFRHEFNRVYTLADGGFHKEGLNLPRFIQVAEQLAQHLDAHHRIEAYIFPKLAKRMPQFKAGAREQGEHLKSHKAIHDGLDKYEAFLSASKQNPSSYNPTTLREIMDSFREVLYRHLEEEVHDLGGPSMRAAGWTLNEIRQIPM
ncbi:hypothetical protein P7C73_g5484, partial [Tremellales sp. Uapishka_1]